MGAVGEGFEEAEERDFGGGEAGGGRGGGGEVQIVFGHQVRVPRTLHLLGGGKVKRVRGVAYATGVSGGNNARMIEAARGVLNRLVGDVYIFSDMLKTV